MAASRWFLWSVVGLAAVLRVGHVLSLRNSPLFDHLQLDHADYDRWALEIASGNVWGSEAFGADPLYAYFLAAIYAVFGHNLLAARLVQAIMGTATVGLTALWARRVLGSTVLANVAGLLLAVSTPLIFYECGLEKTGLALFLSAVALHAYCAGSRRSAAVAGIALGLGVLARGNLLLMLPLGIVVLLLPDRQPPLAGPPRANVQRAILFAGCAAVIIGVGVARNVVVSGDWLLTANLGPNFYMGHNPASVLGVLEYPPFVRNDSRYEQLDFVAEAERRAGRKLSAGEVSRYWFMEGLADIAARPATFVAGTLRKLRLFFHDYELPDNESLTVVASYAPVLRLPILTFGQLLPLAVLGAAVSWRRRRAARLLAIAVGLYTAGIVGFFVLGKLRVLVVPALVVFAAAGLGWLAAAVAERRIAALGFAILALSVVAAFAFARPTWLAQQERAAAAIGYFNLANVLLSKGDTDGAIFAFERAVATDARAVVGARRALGELYLARHQYGRAEEHMRAVLAAKPASSLGHTALVRLYEAMSNDPTYQNDGEVSRKLLDARRALQQLTGAAAAPTK